MQKLSVIFFRITVSFVFDSQVTGIEGNYKHTCHNVMSVLREHRESVMAVLEAFVYDPLLNWRLVEGGKIFTRIKCSTENFMKRSEKINELPHELLDVCHDSLPQNIEPSTAAV